MVTYKHRTNDVINEPSLFMADGSNHSLVRPMSVNI